MKRYDKYFRLKQFKIIDKQGKKDIKVFNLI